MNGTEDGMKGKESIGMENPLIKRKGAYLPHWTRTGAIYSVTFRLADSLPREVLRRLKRERDDLRRRAEAVPGPLPAAFEEKLKKLFSQKIEQYLDAGRGSCLLKDPRAARVVKEAMEHFAGEQYELPAWCVMPNHVHAVVHPLGDHQLSVILHSWKSFTSHEINRRLQRQGTVWQTESYDHLIRDREELETQVDYVLENPRRVGLADWPWIGGSAPEELY